MAANPPYVAGYGNIKKVLEKIREAATNVQGERIRTANQVNYLARLISYVSPAHSVNEESRRHNLQLGNMQIFESLFSNKDAVEKAFGASLLWDRLDEKRASRFRYVMRERGLMNGVDSWCRIQDAMISAMDRLAKAVKPILGKGTA
jgi:hypothetical protein